MRAASRTALHETRAGKEARPASNQRDIDALAEDGQVALRHKAVHGIHHPDRVDLVAERLHEIVVPDVLAVGLQRRRDGTFTALYCKAIARQDERESKAGERKRQKIRSADQGVSSGVKQRRETAVGKWGVEKTELRPR